MQDTASTVRKAQEDKKGHTGNTKHGREDCEQGSSSRNTNRNSIRKKEDKDTVTALCNRLLELHQRSVWLAEHNRAALAELSRKVCASDGDTE